MDKKVLQALNLLQKTVSKMQASMVTKTDAKDFLTKTDAKNLLTKTDAKDFLTKTDAKNFATKNDLKNLVTKNDLKSELSKYPTRDDLKRSMYKLREEISNDIGGVVNGLISELDNKKADKIEIEYLHERVKVIERKIAS